MNTLAARGIAGFGDMPKHEAHVYPQCCPMNGATGAFLASATAPRRSPGSDQCRVSPGPGVSLIRSSGRLAGRRDWRTHGTEGWTEWKEWKLDWISCKAGTRQLAQQLKLS